MISTYKFYDSFLEIFPHVRNGTALHYWRRPSPKRFGIDAACLMTPTEFCTQLAFVIRSIYSFKAYLLQFDSKILFWKLQPLKFDHSLKKKLLEYIMKIFRFWKSANKIPQNFNMKCVLVAGMNCFSFLPFFCSDLFFSFRFFLSDGMIWFFLFRFFFSDSIFVFCFQFFLFWFFFLHAI